NAEDHVSMGANEARQVLDMTRDLSDVLALELYTAAQALDYRNDMLDAARHRRGLPFGARARIRRLTIGSIAGRAALRRVNSSDASQSRALPAWELGGRAVPSKKVPPRGVADGGSFPGGV